MKLSPFSVRSSLEVGLHSLGKHGENYRIATAGWAELHGAPVSPQLCYARYINRGCKPTPVIEAQPPELTPVAVWAGQDLGQAVGSGSEPQKRGRGRAWAGKGRWPSLLLRAVILYNPRAPSECISPEHN